MYSQNDSIQVTTCKRKGFAPCAIFNTQFKINIFTHIKENKCLTCIQHRGPQGGVMMSPLKLCPTCFIQTNVITGAKNKAVMWLAHHRYLCCPSDDVCLDKTCGWSFSTCSALCFYVMPAILVEAWLLVSFQSCPLMILDVIMGGGIFRRQKEMFTKRRSTE